MKNSLFVLILFAVLFVAGCGGSKEVPVAQEQAPAVEAAPKELTLAEKQAMFEVKKKAEDFYEWFDMARGDGTASQNVYVRELEERVLKKVKSQPNFSLWNREDLEDAETSLELTRKRGIVEGIKKRSGEYSMLVNVAPDVLREKTESARSQVLQDLKNMEIQYTTKLDECVHLKEKVDEAMWKRRNAR